MQNYERAIALSPLSEKFLISAGFSAYEMRDDAAAARYFERVLAVDPASADAYAGAGMVALRQGDRARARYDAQRARAADPRSHALLTLETKLNP
jgi:tetratricopeptide (TPR) repeat protein